MIAANAINAEIVFMVFLLKFGVHASDGRAVFGGRSFMAPATNAAITETKTKRGIGLGFTDESLGKSAGGKSTEIVTAGGRMGTLLEVMQAAGRVHCDYLNRIHADKACSCSENEHTERWSALLIRRAQGQLLYRNNGLELVERLLSALVWFTRQSGLGSPSTGSGP